MKTQANTNFTVEHCFHLFYAAFWLSSRELVRQFILSIILHFFWIIFVCLALPEMNSEKEFGWLSFTDHRTFPLISFHPVVIENLKSLLRMKYKESAPWHSANGNKSWENTFSRSNNNKARSESDSILNASRAVALEFGSFYAYITNSGSRNWMEKLELNESFYSAAFTRGAMKRENPEEAERKNFFL